MTLDEFLKLEDVHEISFEQGQVLNEELARIAVSDIPETHHQRISDYLLYVLNMEAASSNIVQILDTLRLSIEEYVRQ